MAKKVLENTKKSVPNTKWKDDHVITAYELAREGLTELQMAKLLGISKETFFNWEKTVPIFRKAIQRGRQYAKRGIRPYTDMMNTVYEQLPEDLKVVWQKLHRFSLAKAGVEKVEALFSRKGGQGLRQKMFLCALVKCNFNIAAACRMVGIPRITVEKWREDVDFQRLVREIQMIEQDWSESCLRRLVESGDFQANKFLLQAIHKDKYGGIGDNVNVNVSGQIDHTHTLVLMENLDLPLNIQKMILAKVRERKQIESKVVEAGGQ
jgi:hypothetical protein